MSEISDTHNDFYQRLRSRISTWLEAGGKEYRFAEYLLAAPDLFHLLVRLIIDRRVSIEDKAWISFAIAYFLCPLDLMPEAISGALGFLDDIVLSAYVLNRMISGNAELIEQYWAGTGDVIELVRGIIGVADRMIGSGLMRQLRSLIGRRAMR